MIRTKPPVKQDPKINIGKSNRVLARFGSGLGRRWVSPLMGTVKKDGNGWYKLRRRAG